MSALKAILAWFLGVFSGMAGGQGKIGGKSLRRFGIPILSTGYALSVQLRWQYLVFLIYIPILSLGYGVDSQLGAICGHIEWLIRLVYAILLSIPLLIFWFCRWFVSLILLITAFQVQAGSLGHISWFGDVLIEDMVRYGVLMFVIISNVLINKKEG